MNLRAAIDCRAPTGGAETSRASTNQLDNRAQIEERRRKLGHGRRTLVLVRHVKVARFSLTYWPIAQLSYLYGIKCKPASDTSRNARRTGSHEYKVLLFFQAPGALVKETYQACKYTHETGIASCASRPRNRLKQLQRTGQ